MSFFDDLGNFLTGKNKLDVTNRQLDIQQQIAENVLKEQIAQDQLKYNPVLAQQRTRQIAVISISIALIVIVVVWAKNR